MKCPNCGAEIQNGKFCEFCGSRITAAMQKEQEQANKAGCPKCGSTNITFNREKQGEVKGKNGTVVVRSTVGLCKDCGYTWRTGEPAQKPKRKTWLWVLGWIFIFPVPLTILMLRNKSVKPAIKYGIIAAGWIIFLLIGIGASANNNSDTTTRQDSTAITDTSAKEDNNTAKAKGHIYDNAEIRDMMNGPRTEKLGEYAVIFANSSSCTEEALADLYYNYYLKNDFSWVMIIYTDKNDDSGIYINKGIIGVNDNFEKDKYGDYSLIESPDEIIYAPNDDGKTLTKVEFNN